MRAHTQTHTPIQTTQNDNEKQKTKQQKHNLN